MAGVIELIFKGINILIKFKGVFIFKLNRNIIRSEPRGNQNHGIRNQGLKISQSLQIT